MFTAPSPAQDAASSPKGAGLRSSRSRLTANPPMCPGSSGVRAAEGAKDTGKAPAAHAAGCRARCDSRQVPLTPPVKSIVWFVFTP